METRKHLILLFTLLLFSQSLKAQTTFDSSINIGVCFQISGWWASTPRYRNKNIRQIPEAGFWRMFFIGHNILEETECYAHGDAKLIMVRRITLIFKIVVKNGEKVLLTISI